MTTKIYLAIIFSGKSAIAQDLLELEPSCVIINADSAKSEGLLIYDHFFFKYPKIAFFKPGLFMNNSGPPIGQLASYFLQSLLLLFPFLLLWGRYGCSVVNASRISYTLAWLKYIDTKEIFSILTPFGVILRNYLTCHQFPEQVCINHRFPKRRQHNLYLRLVDEVSFSRTRQTNNSAGFPIQLGPKARISVLQFL